MPVRFEKPPESLTERPGREQPDNERTKQQEEELKAIEATIYKFRYDLYLRSILDLPPENVLIKTKRTGLFSRKMNLVVVGSCEDLRPLQRTFINCGIEHTVNYDVQV